MAIPVENGSLWDHAVDLAMNNNIKVEAIVVCTPVTTQEEPTAMYDKAIDLNTTYGRRVFFIAAARAINLEQSTAESWSDYVTSIKELTDNLSAFRVSIVPYIYDDALGIYAGRLCNAQTSVADTPMRVATGSIIGQDQSTLPKDKNDKAYSNLVAKALNDQSFSVPAFYADY